MEDDLFKQWGVDRETGKRVYQAVFDDLMDAVKAVLHDENDRNEYEVLVAVAGLKYARELTRDTGGFKHARTTKAMSELSGAIKRCVYWREKRREETPDHSSADEPPSEAILRAVDRSLRPRGRRS